MSTITRNQTGNIDRNFRHPCMADYGTSVGTILRQRRPQATGTSGALLSSDDFGSSVERTAKRHPLWQRSRELVRSLMGEEDRQVVELARRRRCGLNRVWSQDVGDQASAEWARSGSC